MLGKNVVVMAMAAFFAFAVQAAEVVPPEIEQPGTQPQEAGNFETPDRCDNCHAGYDDLEPENEPATGWRGAAWAMPGETRFFGPPWRLPSRILTARATSVFDATVPPAGTRDGRPRQMDPACRRAMIMVSIVIPAMC